MSAPLPTPAEVEGMRERHVATDEDCGIDGCSFQACTYDGETWPCDAARLLALVRRAATGEAS